MNNIGDFLFLHYEQSEIKYVVDAWRVDKFKSSDLKVDFTGYSARLITKYELMTYLGYSNEDVKACAELTFAKSADTPDWVYNSNYPYWIMSPADDSDKYVYRIKSDSMASWGVFGFSGTNNGTVRPVTLLKSAIKYIKSTK